MKHEVWTGVWSHRIEGIFAGIAGGFCVAFTIASVQPLQLHRPWVSEWVYIHRCSMVSRVVIYLQKLQKLCRTFIFISRLYNSWIAICSCRLLDWRKCSKITSYREWHTLAVEEHLVRHLAVNTVKRYLPLSLSFYLVYLSHSVLTASDCQCLWFISLIIECDVVSSFSSDRLFVQCRFICLT